MFIMIVLHACSCLQDKDTFRAEELELPSDQDHQVYLVNDFCFCGGCGQEVGMVGEIVLFIQYLRSYRSAPVGMNA